ncbi:hypothetical protein RUM43_010035 [Polyplax serrata]|uniref:Sugar phosphate transporter domain-containing protein n=1 Tax=Polyplax serrata TaxID=468196 RepID=A0AAN8PKT5_POLSC
MPDKNYNTVGTYQLAKVATTPVVVLLQMLYFKKKFSLKIKFTLIPTVAGIILNFYYDIRFNHIGTCFAVIGVFITSLYQILVGSKQHELQMNPMQLLYYQAPISSIMLIPIMILFEPPYKATTMVLTFTSAGILLLSCIFALFINVSIYWIIGKTSPLTYNMFGHMKFCLIALGGYLVFAEPMSFLQILGVILTLSGVTLYAHWKLKESSQSLKSLEEG